MPIRFIPVAPVVLVFPKVNPLPKEDEELVVPKPEDIPVPVVAVEPKLNPVDEGVLDMPPVPPVVPVLV